MSEDSRNSGTQTGRNRIVTIDCAGLYPNEIDELQRALESRNDFEVDRVVISQTYASLGGQPPISLLNVDTKLFVRFSLRLGYTRRRRVRAIVKAVDEILSNSSLEQNREPRVLYGPNEEVVVTIQQSVIPRRKRKSWSRSERIAVGGIVLTVLVTTLVGVSAVFYPEVRQFLHLEKKPQPTEAQTTTLKSEQGPVIPNPEQSKAEPPKFTKPLNTRKATTPVTSRGDQPAPAPPPRKPIDAQADFLRDWILHMKVNEMWLSQIFQGSLDNMPDRPWVDVPAALRFLSSKGEVEIIETAHRPYVTWWGETFREDIRFKVKKATGETINTGPCSNVQIGGSGNQATTNCEPPPPKIHWQIESKSPYPAQPVNRPQAYVKLTVDRMMENAKFAVICDRPCKAVLGGVDIDGFKEVANATIPNRPEVAAFVINQPNPLPSGITVGLVIESEDDDPINIVDVHRLIITGH